MQCVLGFGGTPPARSELLEGWALPELAKAVKLDEDEAERKKLERWLGDMRNRFAKD